MNTAGIFDSIPADVYHADQTTGEQTPSLSASIAHLLVTASPAHARAAHPRLNPDYQPMADEKFDMGTACHSLLLEGLNVVEVCDFPDWRTKAAKEARDLARAHGRIPLLGHQYDSVLGMYDSVKRQLHDLACDPIPLTDGKPEQTMVWEEDGVLCRARIDWLHTNGDVCDVKTTTRLAVGWDRGPLFDHGCDIQAALYIRGLHAIQGTRTGFDPRWTWLVIETSPPYGLIPYRLTAPVLALGNAKVDMALKVWRECLERDEWPLYDTLPVDAQLPPWVESRWLEKEAEWAT